MKCDVCQAIFCKDHFPYDKHSCEKAYLKDAQVPVCPLCNQPIPSKRGQLPDIAVGEHIDKECQDDRAGQARKKNDPNRCRLKGCKQRNLVPVLCSECKMNFCMRHRHPQDHECDPRSARIPKSMVNSSSGSAQASESLGQKISNLFSRSNGSSMTTMVHGNMSEDEALARALHASLNSASLTPTEGTSRITPASQEDEDRMLAEAIARSRRETSRPSQNQKCNLS